jgi:hypothetical protein
MMANRFESKRSILRTGRRRARGFMRQPVIYLPCTHLIILSSSQLTPDL